MAEDLAVVTGLGQAIIGAVAIGISTSLAGTIVSFYTAWENHPALSIGTSMGGLPAQTAFLAVADMTYRRVNIEHGSASLENLAQGSLLFILLSIPLLAMTMPEITFFTIHPATIILVVSYFAALKVIHHIKEDPMWHPRQTVETQIEEKADEQSRREHPPAKTLALRFSILALILAAAGFTLARAGVEIAEQTFLSETVVGGLFTSVSTSLPELVTTLAAVRRRALNLAVGNIIGGNSFDVLFLAGSDVFYRQGSIYHQINTDHITIISAAMLMTGVLLLGLLRREKRGPAGIGFESVIVFGIYALMVGLLFSG